MTTTPRDQPSQVTTADVLKPSDEHIVTSDTPKADTTEKAPPTPAAAAEVTKPAGANDQDSAPGDTTPPPAPPQKPSRSQRRATKLRKDLEEAQARDAGNQQRIAALEAQVSALTKATPKAPEPQLSDYKSPKEYAKAYAKWDHEAPQPAAKPPENRTPPQPSATPPAPQALVDSELMDFHKRGQEKLGDEFAEAQTSQGTPVNQTMGEYVMDAELGPEIYVHLVNNPDEARRIYDASGPRAIKALDALAARAAKGDLDVGAGDGELKIDPPKEGGAQKKKAGTKAPPPADTSPEGGQSLTPDPENESMDAYASRRRKEEARRQGHIM